MFTLDNLGAKLNLFSASILLTLSLILSGASHADQSLHQALITVSAEGKSKALPDQATISLSFSDTQIDSDKARQNVSKRVDKLLKAIQDYDIKENSLDSSQIRINPQYNYRNNTRDFVGYQVQRTVEFTLSNLEQLSEVITTTTQAGADQLNQVQFSLSKPGAVKAKALNQAIANAKKTANRIAKNFDVTLGKVFSVQHQSSASRAPYPRHRAQLAMAEAASDSNFQQQSIEFTTNITVAFTFD